MKTTHWIVEMKPKGSSFWYQDGLDYESKARARNGKEVTKLVYEMQNPKTRIVRVTIERTVEPED